MNPKQAVTVYLNETGASGEDGQVILKWIAHNRIRSIKAIAETDRAVVSSEIADFVLWVNENQAKVDGRTTAYKPGTYRPGRKKIHDEPVDVRLDVRITQSDFETFKELLNGADTSSMLRAMIQERNAKSQYYRDFSKCPDSLYHACCNDMQDSIRNADLGNVPAFVLNDIVATLAVYGGLQPQDLEPWMLDKDEFNKLQELVG